jgi:hypothetical protein
MAAFAGIVAPAYRSDARAADHAPVDISALGPSLSAAGKGAT